MSKYRIGQTVRLIKLNQVVRIIEIKGRKKADPIPEKLVVIFGNIKTTVLENEVESLNPINIKSRSFKRKDLQVARPVVKSTQGFNMLDLHGLSVSEGIARSEEAISASILEGRKGLEIIHGIGQGRLKTELHKFLNQLEVVARFHLVVGNQGVTRVYFF